MVGFQGNRYWIDHKSLGIQSRQCTKGLIWDAEGLQKDTTNLTVCFSHCRCSLSTSRRTLYLEAIEVRLNWKGWGCSWHGGSSQGSTENMTADCVKRYINPHDEGLTGCKSQWSPVLRRHQTAQQYSNKIRCNQTIHQVATIVGMTKWKSGPVRTTKVKGLWVLQITYLYRDVPDEVRIHRSDMNQGGDALFSTMVSSRLERCWWALKNVFCHLQTN